jgi:hypothetical protein
MNLLSSAFSHSAAVLCLILSASTFTADLSAEVKTKHWGPGPGHGWPGHGYRHPHRTPQIIADWRGAWVRVGRGYHGH